MLFFPLKVSRYFDAYLSMFSDNRKTQTKYLICNSNLVAASDSRNMAHFCVSACVAKSQQNFIAVVIISCAVPHSHAPARPLPSPPHP